MLLKTMLLTGLLLSTGAYAKTFNIVAVPEPESMSLVLIGLGLIGVIVFRKK